MAKIPFDIKFRPEIEAGKYRVVTKAGYPVRILCWDANCKYPIVGLVGGATTEECSYQWKENGRSSIGITFNYDLVLVPVEPEPELGEFEKKLSDVVGYAISLSVTEPKKPTSEFVKEYASELLALARNELVKSGYAIIEGEHYLEEGRKNYERGKAEALKDLPRWVKVNKGDLLDKYSNYLLCSNEGYYYCSGNTITRDGYMLLVDGLEKLPKEE